MYSNGFVFAWASLATFKLSCQFDVTDFPEDEQLCQVKLRQFLLHEHDYTLGEALNNSLNFYAQTFKYRELRFPPSPVYSIWSLYAWLLFCPITNKSFSFRFCPLIRSLSRQKGFLIRLFGMKAFWSDHFQTMVQTQIQIIAQTLNSLWSDSSALKAFMVRPSCSFMIRLKRARNRVWSDSSVLQIIWSEKGFTYE